MHLPTVCSTTKVCAHCPWWLYCYHWHGLAGRMIPVPFWRVPKMFACFSRFGRLGKAWQPEARWDQLGTGHLTIVAPAPWPRLSPTTAWLFGYEMVRSCSRVCSSTIHVLPKILVWFPPWTSDWLIEWLIEWVIDWLIDWLSEWVSDRWIDWLIDRLIDWLRLMWDSLINDAHTWGTHRRYCWPSANLTQRFLHPSQNGCVYVRVWVKLLSNIIYKSIIIISII